METSLPPKAEAGVSRKDICAECRRFDQGSFSADIHSIQDFVGQISGYQGTDAGVDLVKFRARRIASFDGTFRCCLGDRQMMEGIGKEAFRSLVKDARAKRSVTKAALESYPVNERFEGYAADAMLDSVNGAERFPLGAWTPNTQFRSRFGLLSASKL